MEKPGRSGETASRIAPAATLCKIADVPGRTQEGARLNIARKYRNDAAMLAAEVDLRVAELRLDKMDPEP